MKENEEFICGGFYCGSFAAGELVYNFGGASIGEVYFKEEVYSIRHKDSNKS
jgi:hypothetical protein